VNPELHFWPSPLQALALVASPRLGLRHVDNLLVSIGVHSKPQHIQRFIVVYFIIACKPPHHSLQFSIIYKMLVPILQKRSLDGLEQNFHPYEELLHTFTTKICTHNKNPVGNGTTM
jgi:hypothetical protein